ncbi:MAG: glycosyltransferase [Thermoleophilaceae bacterium]
MTDADRAPLRIALVHHSPGLETAQLARALLAVGHEADVVTTRGLPAAEKLLRYRGFATPLTQVPSTFAALARGHYDLAHAFSPQDALATLLWRRRGGGPVVFTPVEPPRRETLADRRLSLKLVRRALDESDAVVALTPEHRDAFSRWLALDVPVIEAPDAAGWDRLYRELSGVRA